MSSNLYLMYDNPLRTTPLGPNEAVAVEFDTTQEGEITRYYVLIFGDGSIQVIRGDEDLGRGAPGEVVGNLFGAAGFDLHVMAELELPLIAGEGVGDYVGGVYSPDPAWWSSSVPSDPDGPQEELVCCVGEFLVGFGGFAECLPEDLCAEAGGENLGLCPDGSEIFDPCGAVSIGGCCLSPTASCEAAPGVCEASGGSFVLGGFCNPEGVCVSFDGAGIIDPIETSNAIITANEDGNTDVLVTPPGFEPGEIPVSSCRGKGDGDDDDDDDDNGSCRGILDVGENSCNGEDSCQADEGNFLLIGDSSCNGEDSCNGNNNIVGNGSCNGEDSCRGDNNNIGDGVCNGDNDCNGDNNVFGDDDDDDDDVNIITIGRDDDDDDD